MVLVAMALVVAGAIPMLMQTSTGHIEGIVTDERGPVAGASIEAHHLLMGKSRRTSSDEQGMYHLDRLERGTYSLWITAVGHMSVEIPRVFVESDTPTRLNIRLGTLRSQSASE